MRNMYFSEAVADAIRFEMEKDPTVFCIGEDVGFVDGSMALPEDYTSSLEKRGFVIHPWLSR